MAEVNVLQNQLQTEQIEMPTILVAMQDSGAIDVTLEEDEHANETTVEIHGKNCLDSEYTNTKLHKETQTEIFPFCLLISRSRSQLWKSGSNISKANILRF